MPSRANNLAGDGLLCGSAAGARSAATGRGSGGGIRFSVSRATNVTSTAEIRWSGANAANATPALLIPATSPPRIGPLNAPTSPIDRRNAWTEPRASGATMS